MEAVITHAAVREFHTSRGAISHYPEITYRYEYRGTEHTGQRIAFGVLMPERFEAEEMVARFAVGTRCEVRACEGQPELSVLNPGVTGSQLTGLAIYVLLAIGAAGMVFLMVPKSFGA